MNLSTQQNCIFFNSLIKNGSPINVSDVQLFQQFRDNLTPEIQSEYYSKIEPLIEQIKTTKGDTVETWMQYHSTYVQDILSCLKNNDAQTALEKTRNMLQEIEADLQGE
jgi:phage terminase large subunit-like protein